VPRFYNRQYLFNVSCLLIVTLQVVNTLKPEFFRKNIKGAIKKRSEKNMWKLNQYIEMS
jgi:hypothetical protein